MSKPVKNCIQEICQKYKYNLPIYKTTLYNNCLDSNINIFKCELTIPRELQVSKTCIYVSYGNSKKEAETKAANLFWNDYNLINECV